MIDDEFPYEICPECGRDSKDHKISNHFCEFENKRVVTMIDVHKSFINKIIKENEKRK